MKLSICVVCKSDKIIERYPSNIDLDRLTFTYTKTPDSNKTFRVVRCLNCTHVFCSPVQKNIYKNYKDVVDDEYLGYADSLKISSNLVLPIIKNYIPKGKILDVGCATGEFLQVARNFGYTAEGLELSKWSSEIARKKGLKIYRQSLKTLSKKFPKRYDIITLFGVIEHFEFPADEINYLNILLKPGGILVVWTGDVDSIMSKILRRRWWYWQGQHIQYFSHKSLNTLFKKRGFEHIATNIYPFVATYKLMHNYLGRYYFRPWIMKLVKPLFLLKPAWTIRLPGEMLYVAGKKKCLK
ncbi:class I SAM-dependent methyltransferase [Patescibacteria group bacterium]|nr:class I SAM-dependent methyltransferase [Patescibacteria group bacterium]